MNSRYGLVFIDADDTLFDFQRCESEALAATLREAGIEDGRAEALYKEINARAWADVEKGTRSRDEIKAWRFAELFRALGLKCRDGQGVGLPDGDPDGGLDASAIGEAYLDRLSREAWLLEGAREILEWLRARCKVILLTNGITKVQKGRLAQADLNSAFDQVLISEEVGLAKPDPRIFAHGASLAGFSDKSRMLIVGDSLSSDIAGGRAYGIATCWFNPAGRILPENEARPDWNIARLDELKGIVGR